MRRKVTAREYILSVLREFSENEMTALDLWKWQEGRVSPVRDKNTIFKTLYDLEAKHQVERNVDAEERVIYWHIAG